MDWNRPYLRTTFVFAAVMELGVFRSLEVRVLRGVSVRGRPAAPELNITWAFSSEEERTTHFLMPSNKGITKSLGRGIVIPKAHQVYAPLAYRKPCNCMQELQLVCMAH